jgi:hypothetical protein
MLSKLLAAIDRDLEHEQDKHHSDGRGRERQTPLADDQLGISLGEGARSAGLDSAASGWYRHPTADT